MDDSRKSALEISLFEFEKSALRLLSPLFGESRVDFLNQVNSAKALHRTHSNVGFYTNVQVDRMRCRPVRFNKQGGLFEVTDIGGVGVIIWEAIAGDGFLAKIEVFTFAERPIPPECISSLKILKRTS